jgi:hypothetical protein
MKKVLLYGLTVFLIQSCTVSEHKPNCNQDITDLINYEDTIKVEFKGIDSLVFKNKDYKHTADSLMANHNDVYMRIDVQNIHTGYIHRIVFSREMASHYLYDEANYKRVR